MSDNLRNAPSDVIYDQADLLGLEGDERRIFLIYLIANFPNRRVGEIGEIFRQHQEEIYAILTQSAPLVPVTQEDRRMMERLDEIRQLREASDDELFQVVRIASQVANDRVRSQIIQLIERVQFEREVHEQRVRAWQGEDGIENPFRGNYPVESTRARDQLITIYEELAPVFEARVEELQQAVISNASFLLQQDLSAEGPITEYIANQLREFYQDGDLERFTQLNRDIDDLAAFNLSIGRMSPEQKEEVIKELTRSIPLNQLKLTLIETNPTPLEPGFVVPRARPARQGRRSVIVGAKWKGVVAVEERISQRGGVCTYIPSEGHCYFKVIRKALEYLAYITPVAVQFYTDLISKLDAMSYAGIQQDNLSIQVARDRVMDALIPCLTTCDRLASKNYKTKHSDQCNHYRHNMYYSVYPSGIGLPSEYHVFQEKEEVVCKLFTHDDRVPNCNRNHTMIVGLLNMTEDYFHTALYVVPVIQGQGKTKYRNLLSVSDIQVKLTHSTTLDNKCIKFRPFKIKPIRDVAVVYDIETFNRRAPLFRQLLYKDKEVPVELVPYAAGYALVDLKKFTLIPDSYHEIIIPNKDVDLYDLLFEAMYNDPNVPDDVQVFAHNGNRFDNLYVKKCKSVTFVSQIGSIGKLKSLTVSYPRITLPPNLSMNTEIRTKTFTFKDTLPFILQSLKAACETLKTEHRKIDFDIVGWSYEQYEAYRYLPYQITPDLTPAHLKHMEEHKNFNWRMYLYYDVICLGELLAKIEELFVTKLGVSTSWTTGIPGVAWINMEMNCAGIKELYVPMSESLVSFFKEGCYGGRVLTWKRYYKAPETPTLVMNNGKVSFMHQGVDITKTYGMMSIDMNSLYPSAYATCSFPVGHPELIPPEMTFEELDKFPHYEAEVEILIPNYQYTWAPYRTSCGNVIYPSNATIRGVYYDVDIREMVKDGYQVVKVIRGVFFRKGYRLFKYLVETLYKLRSEYKKMTDPAVKCFEYCIKIVLNSQFGKMLETIDSKTHFEELCEDVIKNSQFTKTTKLNNGQFEHSSKLKKTVVRKPTYIGGYVTAHARAICNEIIRTAGPENIYYSDTDSFYIEKRILVEKGMKCGKELGQFDNDYDGKTIVEAVFLDNKRYYLDLVSTKDGRKTVKMKFNGLSFSATKKTKDSIDGSYTSFSYPVMSDLAIDALSLEEANQVYADRHKLIKTLFDNLLENYSSRQNMLRYYGLNSLCQYSEYVKPENKEQLVANAKLYAEWAKQNLKMMLYVIEKWVKTQGKVYIVQQEMRFQIDPHKRGQWIPHPNPQKAEDLYQDQFYALGANPNLPIIPNNSTPFAQSPDNRIGYYREKQAEAKVYTFRADYKRKCAGTGGTCGRNMQKTCDGKCKRSVPDRVHLCAARVFTYDPELHPVLKQAANSPTKTTKQKSSSLERIGLKSNSVTLVSEMTNPQANPHVIERVHTHFYLATYYENERLVSKIIELNPANRLTINGENYRVGLKIEPAGKVPFYYQTNKENKDDKDDVNIFPPGYHLQEILACDVNEVKHLLGENTPDQGDVDEIISYCQSLPVWYNVPTQIEGSRVKQRKLVAEQPLNKREDMWRNYSLN